MYPMAVAEDVCVEVKMDGEGPRMGADAQLSIVVKNLSSQPRRTTLHSQVAVMYYTGVLKGTIKKEQVPVELLPNEGWLSPETIQLLLSRFLCQHWAPSQLEIETPGDWTHCRQNGFISFIYDQG